MDLQPDFYLDPTEDGNLEELRACWRRGSARDARDIEYLVVEVSPPIIGQRYGLGDKDISLVVLSPRHQGHKLNPITVWPEFAYVARIVDEAVLTSGTVTVDNVKLILIGVLHRSREEAAKVIKI